MSRERNISVSDNSWSLPWRLLFSHLDTRISLFWHSTNASLVESKYVLNCTEICSKIADWPRSFHYHYDGRWASLQSSDVNAHLIIPQIRRGTPPWGRHNTTFSSTHSDISVDYGGSGCGDLDNAWNSSGLVVEPEGWEPGAMVYKQATCELNKH